MRTIIRDIFTQLNWKANEKSQRNANNDQRLLHPARKSFAKYFTCKWLYFYFQFMILREDFYAETILKL